MTLKEFRMMTAAPDFGPLAALWHDAHDRWDEAHHIVQTDDSAAAAWVHAYLHRKGGEESNAAYWYARAEQPVFTGPWDEEWAALATVLLERNH